MKTEEVKKLLMEAGMNDVEAQETAVLGRILAEVNPVPVLAYNMDSQVKNVEILIKTARLFELAGKVEGTPESVFIQPILLSAMAAEEEMFEDEENPVAKATSSIVSKLKESVKNGEVSLDEIRGPGEIRLSNKVEKDADLEFLTQAAASTYILLKDQTNEGGRVAIPAHELIAGVCGFIPFLVEQVAPDSENLAVLRDPLSVARVFKRVSHKLFGGGVGFAVEIDTETGSARKVTIEEAVDYVVDSLTSGTAVH